ncbi:MAG: Rpn family recombination-promoting nuclease/putative transposase [Gammaproteobacteria bacterium]|nr:Rpn family recombination-promoting nuclease/putative transposase [Gammaproteobacteria bacterium]
MSKLHNPHDSFSKLCLTNSAVAVDFLKAHLPESIKQRCDFTSLRIEPTAYIEEDLRQHMADILYSLTIDKKPGLIYCLVENQSKPERLMPLRFWRYQASILKKYAENNKSAKQKLPVIVPLLLYTGTQSPYPYSLDLADCFYDPVLARQVLSQPARLIDLSVTSDDEIKTHGKAALLELVQKHIRGRDIIALTREVVALLRPVYVSRDLASNVIKYLVSEGESQDAAGIIELFKSETEYRSEAMTIAEQIEQWGVVKGMQQGMQQGKLEEARAIAKNLLARGLDFDLIKDTTGLSAEELNKLSTAH